MCFVGKILLSTLLYFFSLIFELCKNRWKTKFRLDKTVGVLKEFPFVGGSIAPPSLLLINQTKELRIQPHTYFKLFQIIA